MGNGNRKCCDELTKKGGKGVGRELAHKKKTNQCTRGGGGGTMPASVAKRNNEKAGGVLRSGDKGERGEKGE